MPRLCSEYRVSTPPRAEGRECVQVVCRETGRNPASHTRRRNAADTVQGVMGSPRLDPGSRGRTERWKDIRQRAATTRPGPKPDEERIRRMG